MIHHTVGTSAITAQEPKGLITSQEKNKGGKEKEKKKKEKRERG
jgi:hypothetical protein